MAAPLTQPLHWREGMFLRQHHFQHFYRQLGQHLAFLLDAQFPHRWGVLRMVHDERLLPTGSLRITDFAAVLRDGLIVTGDLLARPLELDLKPLQNALKGQYRAIYLGIPVAGRAEVVDFTSKVPADDALPRRFRPIPREVVDLNTGEDAQAIDCIAINGRLLTEEEDRAGFECLKIAEVQYEEDSFKFNPDYCPPSILTLPEAPLHRLCTRVLNDLREGARYVMGLSAQLAGHRDAVSLEMRLKVHGLLGSVPPLEGLLGSGACRPLDLYLALTRVLGDLVGLEAEGDLIPEPVPRYDHEDLTGTFAVLEKRIAECLGPILRKKYPSYPFLPAGDQEFQLKEFNPEWLTGKVFLAVQSAGPAEDTQRWMENCLIGAPAGLADYRRRLVLGLDRKPVKDPPAEIRLKAGWSLYQLMVDPRIHGPIVEAIKGEKALGVRVGWQATAGAQSPQKLSLMVKAEEVQR